MNKRTMAFIPKWVGPNDLAYLAAAQIEIGAVDDAAATVAEWKHRFPDGAAEVVLGYPPFHDRQQEPDQLLASLQKAGAPICVASNKFGNFPGLKHLAVCDARRAKEASQ